jgi:hypothetical protein
MAEGTATAELGTAEAPVEATELVEAPESELLEPTETDGSDATTDSDEATEEDDSEPEVISKAEHEKLLKAEKAKLEESFRQKTENAQRQAEEAANRQAYTANVSRSQQARAEATFQQMASTIRQVIQRRENGEEIDISPQWLASVAAQQADAAFWDQDSAIAAAFQGWASRNGYRPPTELTAKVERALHLPPSDPNRITQVFEARMELLEAAAEERVRPKVREEEKAKLNGNAKVDAMKQNDQARANAPKPTAVGVTGAGPRRVNFKTQQAVDMALYKGEIDSNTARQWLSKGLPYS